MNDVQNANDDGQVKAYLELPGRIAHVRRCIIFLLAVVSAVVALVHLDQVKDMASRYGNEDYKILLGLVLGTTTALAIALGNRMLRASIEWTVIGLVLVNLLGVFMLGHLISFFELNLIFAVFTFFGAVSLTLLGRLLLPSIVGWEKLQNRLAVMIGFSLLLLVVYWFYAFKFPDGFWYYTQPQGIAGQVKLQNAAGVSLWGFNTKFFSESVLGESQIRLMIQVVFFLFSIFIFVAVWFFTAVSRSLRLSLCLAAISFTGLVALTESVLAIPGSTSEDYKWHVAVAVVFQLTTFGLLSLFLKFGFTPEVIVAEVVEPEIEMAQLAE